LEKNTVYGGSLMWNFMQLALIAFLLGQNILLSTLTSNIHSLCFSLNVRGQVSHRTKLQRK
jgi:hypothetical protein